jgi:glycosyltransferase involved in cell wall biosynthesis
MDTEPMNILFINSIQCWGGGEVWLMDVMRELGQRGHAVTLICRPNTPLSRNAIERGYDVVQMRFGGDFDPVVLWKVWRVIKKRAFDVVCTNTEKDLRIGGIAGKFAGISAIIPSREVDYPLKPTLAYRLAYKYLASKIVANSHATKVTLLRSAPYLKAAKISVIFKGIDITYYNHTPDFSLRTFYGLPSTAPIISFVGRLDERKGIYELLDAWKEIHAHHRDAVLLIIGDGTMRPEIERFMGKESLGGSIILCGFHQNVPHILLQSTMLVLPSHWEGFGYVLIEAMAARIPVIASHISSIPEIVVDGTSGILVEPKNPESIARAVCRLLENPTLAAAMGRAGRGIVEQKFTLQRMIDDFETVLRNQIDITQRAVKGYETESLATGRN